MKCCVTNCTNNSKTKTKRHGVSFHMLPKEPSLRAIWIKVLGIPDPDEKSTICSEHFRDEDVYKIGKGVRKIKIGAVPVIDKDCPDEFDEPAAFRVCRICLAIDVKMYNIGDHGLDDLYEQITGIMVVGEERLPQNVCFECVARLNSAVRFKNRAMKTLELMQEYLGRDDYVITIRDILTLNYSHEDLKSPLVQKFYSDTDYDIHINDIFDKNKGDQSEEYEIEGEGSPEVKSEIEEPSEEEGAKSAEESQEDFEDDEEANENNIGSENEEEMSEEVLEEDSASKRNDKQTLRYLNDVVLNLTESYRNRKIRRLAPDLDKTLFTITTLTYEEQMEEVRQRKNSVSYITSEYKCSVCYRGYEDMDSYEAHMMKHSERFGSFECFICRTRVKTQTALRHHITARHTEEYSCNGCTFVTRHRSVAKDHEKWHAGTKYQCEHCNEVFEKRSTYLGHLRIKHVSDCVCELCGYTFVSKKGIEVHKQKKHVLDEGTPLDGPYCKVCEVQFASEEAHDRHLMLSSKHTTDHDPNRIRNSFQSKNRKPKGRSKGRVERRPIIHRVKPQLVVREPITCEQCNIELPDLRTYAQHFRRSHPDKNRTKFTSKNTPCMCEQCGKVFRMVSLLDAHMWVHTGQKPYKCDYCDKTFTQKTNLIDHEQLHTGNKKTFECPICGKHFANVTNRKRHMFCNIELPDLRTYAQHFRRSHPDKNRTKFTSKNTPCMCEQCGKVFRMVSLLDAHMWVHTGQKPYKCDYCDKTFTQKTNLIDHEQLHTGNKKTFECPICGKHFANVTNRKRHMFLHTGLKPFKCDICGKLSTTTAEQRTHFEHVHQKKPWPKRVRHRQKKQESSSEEDL